MRPLYLFVDQFLCAFATNLRTLRALVGTRLEIDEAGLAETLLLRYCVGSRTIYKNVQVIQPGRAITVSAQDVQTRCYFDWNAIETRNDNEPAACEALYEAFIRAIRRRSRRQTEEAFLSGGLDSRCVVAGLLDIGRSVRTFGSSYPQSADDVISQLVASTFGTEHTRHHRDPIDNLRFGRVFYPRIARDSFPTETGQPQSRARVIWSGDGGSLCMGNIFLNERRSELASGSLSDADLRELFPSTGGYGRLMKMGVAAKLRALALQGIRSELRAITPRQKNRRLFLYHLLNHRMGHHDAHYEDIDLTEVEFESPFFDTDMVSLITALPAEMFLYHRLYNRWLTYFKTPVATLPWQVYPGHIAGPHPMPSGVTDQWASDWQRGNRESRRLADFVASQLLATGDKRLNEYLSRPKLLGLRVLNRLGVERSNYELWRTRHVFQTVTGQTIADSRT